MIRDAYQESKRIDSALATAGFFIKRDTPSPPPLSLSLLSFPSCTLVDRALSCNELESSVRILSARCIARSDELDPIEPLRTTAESYPEMAGIDVTARSLSLSSSRSLALSATRRQGIANAGFT